MKREPEIYCPKCKWRPRAEDRWVCMASCNASWNTFWTGGVCPKCSYRWLKTQCLSCQEISPHKAWYHYPQGGNESKRESAEKPAVVDS